MFRKVLIANRGAIACRIIRTLDRMGIASVAVYSDADRHAMHVMRAGEAVAIGPSPAAESYLKADAILDAARQTGAEAIHPGYGFLSENPGFAEACEEAGIVFIGPRPLHMRAFGLKHRARELALQSEVPVAPGSLLLRDIRHAMSEASRIGYPLMIKSTAGGGGIGLQLVTDARDLAPMYERVERLARNNFKNAGIFIEKYVARGRHIEVQIFGDGKGNVVSLGERDCSAQRRNQKVVEETPAPNLPEATRAALWETARRLGETVNYESAGTVEYLYDATTNEFYFLEVNTRLQVEHGVTEEVNGVDLVEWMVRQAAGEMPPLDQASIKPSGASIQVRLYAEDPGRDFRPSSGLLTHVAWPKDTRIETWVESGSEVSPFYDPMLAKIIVTGATRDEALSKLQAALDATEIGGLETNLDYLRQLSRLDILARGEMLTRTLQDVVYQADTIEVVAPGTQTTIQDWPGRVGYWAVGVPPSGPMDPLSFRLANRLVGNAEDAAGIETTLAGPTLKFNSDALVCLAGAELTATLDGKPVPYWQAFAVNAGQVLKLGGVAGPGTRAYIAVRGGIDVPKYLGSRSTFTLGKFGGHGGRTLRAGDVLHIGAAPAAAAKTAALAGELQPRLTHAWDIGVLYGPHGAPDFFTPDYIDTFFAADWEVHYNSNPTGIRLIGPKPGWAREDGGEAGLHPSNIHDNAYAIGTIDFTGDMPVILGPDGPSLGGFVCPVTIAQAELWKMGQLRPGDKVRFVRLTPAEAARRLAQQDAEIAALASVASPQMSAREVRRRRLHRRLQRRDSRHAERHLPPRRRCLSADRIRPHRARFCLAIPRSCADAGRWKGRRIGRAHRHRRSDSRHPLAANSLRPPPARARRSDRRAPVDRRRSRRPLRHGGGLARGAAAAVVERRSGADHHRQIHARRARRRALVSVQHRVHPPHQRPRLDRRGEAHRLCRDLSCARSRRRLSRRAGGNPGRSASPPGHHEIQSCAHLDA